MSGNWPSQVYSVLQKIATHLAPTAKAAFAIYVRQAYATGIVDAAYVLLGGVLLIAGLIGVRICVPKADWGDSDDPYCWATVGSIVAGAIGLLLIVANVGGAVMRLYNPDYYAIQLLLSAAK